MVIRGHQVRTAPNADAVIQDPPPIRTPDQRLRVFISSTMEDLADERRAAREAVEHLRLAPVMFELSARSHPARALYKAYIEQSEIFVGIYWQRYGWIAPDMEISGLEDEYELCGNRPRLVYLKRPAPELEPRLAELVRRIEDDGLSSYRIFETAEELHAIVVDDLALLLSEAFGWPGSSSPTGAEASRQLPMPLTRLIDRERELDDLSSLLCDEAARLVTVTGVGGTGKSRLALDAARRVEGDFSGGALFVDLAPITAADLVLPQIAGALGVRSEGNRPLLETVTDYLARRRVLLVLDNFEQVAQAAPLLGSVLESCPGVSALVTSRVPLLIRGEREYRVPPLPTSDASSPQTREEIATAPATELFVERAGDTVPGFALTEENAVAVAEICRRLDGMPLALELAAARVRLLPPAELVERLGHPLDLSAGLKDVPERQRTLRATIDWSYELLAEPERAVFAQLASFSGGFALPAVEAICGEDDGQDPLDTLSSLLEKSLVAAGSPTTSEPRFRMLEVVREYARERLAARNDCERIARRHAEYYVGFCEEAGPHLYEREQGLWFARLDAELGNIRALVDWALRADEHELIIRAWTSTMVYWWVRGHTAEMWPTLERIVPLPRAAPAKTRGEAAWLLGTCRVTSGDREGAAPLFHEALAMARQAEDLQGEALSLGMLGAVAPATTGTYGAWALHHEALAIVRRLGWRWGIAYILHHLGDTAIRDGDTAAVIAIDTECLDVARQIDNEPLATMALWRMGWGHLLEGEPALAREALTGAAVSSIRLRSIENMSYCLDGFAGVAMATGDAGLAARFAGAADAARKLLRMETFPPLVSAVNRLRAPAYDALGDASFAAEHAAGAELAPEDALELALGRAGVR